MARYTVTSLVSAALLASRAAALVPSTFLAPRDTECLSYGVDFQNGGSYFQNISSTANFTFVSIFEGCQDDVANNILVDAEGDEWQCTDTDLTPDDTNQISTCPLAKDELSSGEWSVVIISNNGESGDPIAYERDFYLTVGVPVTTTYTPTLTLSTTTTPIINTTVTSTTSLTTVLTSTTTVPSRTYSPTVTSTPSRITTTVTRTIGTISKTKRVVVASVITKTHTASCSLPPPQVHPDPTCTITPTLVTAAALSTDAAASSAGAARFRRMPDAKRVPVDRAQRIAERKAALAARKVDKRSPDASVVVVTDLNTVDWATITSTSTAAASTMTISTQAVFTTTSTSTLTVQSGKTTLPVVTVTLPTPTLTRAKFTVVTSTVATSTRTQTVTVTTTTVNSASASVCYIKGGQMI